MKYALKKLYLRISLGRGPRLEPHIAHGVRVRMGMVLSCNYRPNDGLCGVITNPLGVVEWASADLWLRHQFQLWPHNSGRKSFPVPHPDKQPCEAYFLAQHTHQMWDGEYGQMRLSLAKHLLDAATRDLGIKR